MKKITLLFTPVLASLFLLGSCGSNKTTETTTTSDSTTTVPYTVKVEEIVVPGLPDLHSYTHAIYEDKIVMFGGRTSGLHSFNYLFQSTRSNDSIYVVDTKKWSEPTSWVVHAMNYKDLVTKNKISLRPFRANNAEFFTRDNKLYVFGGLYGDRKDTPVTLPYLTAINLPIFINSVITKSKTPIELGAIRQLTDTSFALTGGEISVMGNKVYLAFGWNYRGVLPAGNDTDYYSHQVKSFTLTDEGKESELVGPITSWNDGHSNAIDTNAFANEGQFRRRDGSMSPMIDPANGEQMLLYYAGVFKGGATNFTTPVWITSTDATEQTFEMRSNIYTCQVIPVYSSSRKQSFGTLLGGMKNATYIPQQNQSFPMLLTANNAPFNIVDSATLNNFTFAPFSNQFTTVRIDSNHNFTQYLLADSFPVTAVSYTLPAASVAPFNHDTVIPAGSAMFNGAESEMHWNLDKKYLMPNGVVNYDAFVTDFPNGGSVGYLHGGILSSYPNILQIKNSFHYSMASNRLFRVKIVPLAKK